MGDPMGYAAFRVLGFESPPVQNALEIESLKFYGPKSLEYENKFQTPAPVSASDKEVPATEPTRPRVLRRGFSAQIFPLTCLKTHARKH